MRSSRLLLATKHSALSRPAGSPGPACAAQRCRWILSLSCKCVNNGDGAAVLLDGRPCKRGSLNAAGLWRGRAAIRAAQCMFGSLLRDPGHCLAPSSPCHPRPRSCRSQQPHHPAIMLRAALLQLPRAFLPAATATAALRGRPLHAAVVCCQPPAAPPAAPKAPAIPPVKRISRGGCLGAWCSLVWLCAAVATARHAACVSSSPASHISFPCCCAAAVQLNRSQLSTVLTSCPYFCGCCR